MKRNFLSLLLMIVLLLSVTAEAEDRFTISETIQWTALAGKLSDCSE